LLTEYVADAEVLTHYVADGAAAVSSDVIEIKHYMREFTINDLRLDTEYELCLTVNKQTSNLNCTRVRTRKQRDLGQAGLRNVFTPDVIALVVAVVTSVFVTMAVLTFAARRYNKARLRRYQDDVIYQDHVSQLFLAGMDSLSNVASETYENEAAVAITTSTATSAVFFDEADLEEIVSTASMSFSVKPQTCKQGSVL